MVAGSTGYIGKYVTKELIKRGYNVVAFAREKSGVGGKQSREQTQKVDLSLCILRLPRLLIYKTILFEWQHLHPLALP